MRTAASPLAPAKPARQIGLGCALPFGLLFAVVGSVAFWFVTLRPLLRASASADWIETPCEILSSELASSHDSDGTTYRVAIRYRYEWPPASLAVERGGSGAIGEAPARAVPARPYESDRYDFTEGSTNVGVKKMRAAVRAHPPGRRTVCYVDPADPAFAVLVRDTSATVWFGAFTLLFPLMGIGFVVSAWRARGRAARSPLDVAAAPAVSPALRRRLARGVALPPDAAAPVAPGEVVLKPAAGRLATFIGITFFALFWNGILGVIAYNVIADFGGGLAWFFVLFLVPFVLIGLLILGAAFQAFSRLFAPPVELRLDPSLLRVGARVPFTWRLGGRGVRKLTIRLVAREEATYRQGTNTSTDKSDFHRAVVVESTDTLALSEGRAELVLPAGSAAPAFSARNNKLVWELTFEGEIPWRADVDDRFILPVRGPAAPLSLGVTPEPRAHAGGGLTLWTVDRFAPGETLVFTVARDASAAPGPLTVQLGWFTEGKGTRDAAIAWTEHLSELAPGADRSFELRLPEAPWSFAGKLVAVEWRLEVLDARREPLVAVPLVIAPGGSAVHLPALPPEPSAFQKRKARYLARKQP